MPEISIIVPVYKAEKSIERCVNSIINQSFNDFELILVDDGSPDESGCVCDTLAKTDSRIIVIHKQNGGVSSARNAGLDIARGSYIMFCDSDDYVLDGWISSLFGALDSETDMSVCEYVISTNGIINEFETTNSDATNITKKEIWKLFNSTLLNSPCNKIFKKDIIEDNHIRFNENLSDGEDLLFNLEYLVHANENINVISDKLYCYINNPDSLTTSYIKNFWQIKKTVMDELKRYLTLLGVNFEDISNDYYSFYLDVALRCINNTFKKGNTDSFIKKFNTNRNIIKSPEFNIAVSNADLSKYNKLYSLCLKSRIYFLLWLYKLLSGLILH